MNIRAIESEELPQLLDLYRHLNPSDLPVPAEPELATRWQAFLAHPGLTCLVACEGPALVASCCLVVIPNLTRGCRPYAVIENVVTNTRYRQQGFGTAVLRRALDLAWEAGCYKAMLLTGSKRSETLRFYEQCGFVSDEKTGFVARPS
jgi:GNAT superfamily N-acetyltransferase